MTDRPIIFSAPMVRALLADRKTQARRLATSPLRRCEVGDRLYVREAWSHTGDGVFEVFQARLLGRGGVIYRADDNPKSSHAKFWPSLHMPREFSRLTLTVTDVRVEPLRAISEGDAKAEGVRTDRVGAGTFIGHEDVIDGRRWVTNWPTAVEAYADLWSTLHPRAGEGWEDNPQVVALTFTIERGNIDQPVAT